MQKKYDGMTETIGIHEEHPVTLTGRSYLEATDSDECRLTKKGKVWNNYLQLAVEPAWSAGMRHSSCYLEQNIFGICLPYGLNSDSMINF